LAHDVSLQTTKCKKKAQEQMLGAGSARVQPDPRGVS